MPGVPPGNAPSGLAPDNIYIFIIVDRYIIS